MESIFEFCVKRIKQRSAYRANKFREGLVKLASMETQIWATKPGSFSEEVNVKNQGETAFQRALYKHKHLSLVEGGVPTAIKLMDIELPVTLSKKSRRRCVDLIVELSQKMMVLCELKYAKSEQASESTGADYAIFEALLYYAIVNRDYRVLDEQKVCRSPDMPRFSWKAVSESQSIIVLANDHFWKQARRTQNTKRVIGLVEEIRLSLGIRVILCAMGNHEFFRLENVVSKKYKPKFVSFAEEKSVDAFPAYRLILSFD